MFIFIVLTSSFFWMHDLRGSGGYHQASLPPAKKYGLALGDTLVWMNSRQLNGELDTIKQLGVGWIRIDLDWSDIQPTGENSYDWSKFDRVVDAADRRGIKIMPILAYTPKWARPSDCAYSAQCAPAHDDQFAAFAQKAAARYTAQGINTWEIWNEPNLGGSWKPDPDPKDYTKLLKVTYAAIKKESPDAKIVSGGMGPLDQSHDSINQMNFLAGMYAAGAEPYFDALGLHPYSYPVLPNYVVNWSSWSVMAELPHNLRKLMATNGDSAKQIWITEYGAPTNGPLGLATTSNYNLNGRPDHVDEALQAKTMEVAVKLYQRTPWLGAYFWYDYQDLGTSRNTNENFFGLLRYDGSKKPAFYAYQHAIAESKK